MSIPLIFFLLLIPLSGFIAWCGDLIGHRIGKRRHTLWNLRPRHTATLFTVGAGMCISLVSFAIMWMASETFRVVLQEGATLLQANHALRGENTDLQTRNRRTERVVRENKTEIGRLNGEAQKAESAAKIAAAAKQKALQNLQQTTRLYQSAEASLTSAKSDLDAEKGRLAAAQSRLSTTRGELQNKERRVLEMRRNYESVRTRFVSAQKGLAKAQKSVLATQNQLAAAEKSASAGLKYQREKLAALKRQNEELDNRFAQQEGQAERSRIELSRINAEVKARRAEAEQLFNQSLTATTNLRQGKIIYQNGEEVARIAIDNTASPFRTRVALDKLLALAGENSEARGASKSGAARAAILPARLVRVNETDDETRAVSEPELLQAALAVITKSQEPVVVVAVAAANTVRGEPVLLELKTFRNPLVLASGAKVAEITIDGHDDRQQVLDKLYTFLRRDVRQKLLAAGVIPPLMGQEESSLVTINGAEWLQLVANVRDTVGDALVTVRAAKDLRAADAVALTFDVQAKELTRIGKRN